MSIIVLIMRGHDLHQDAMFSYLSPEQRVPQDHPLRPIRRMTDQALQRLSPRFERMYADIGRPSIAPEKLLRALLLQVLYTIRSERMLMEQLDYNLLFRWFVGLNMDDVVWVPTVFSKNRDRLLEGAVAEAFFDEVLREAGEQELLSEEHFTVDGTLLEAWASQKSFQRKDAPEGPPPEDPGNPTVDFHKEKRTVDRRQTRTLGWPGRAKARRPSLRRARADGEVNVRQVTVLAICGNGRPRRTWRRTRIGGAVRHRDKGHPSVKAIREGKAAKGRNLVGA